MWTVKVLMQIYTESSLDLDSACCWEILMEGTMNLGEPCVLDFYQFNDNITVHSIFFLFRRKVKNNLGLGISSNEIKFN